MKQNRGRVLEFVAPEDMLVIFVLRLRERREMFGVEAKWHARKRRKLARLAELITNAAERYLSTEDYVEKAQCSSCA